MKHFKTQIILNEPIAEDIYKMTVAAGIIAKEVMPGQFLHIQCQDDINPLLRRPFSVHRVVGENIEIFYKVVGKGTKILSQKKADDGIDIIGPLGNGFEINQTIDTVILVSGGMGFAPLIFLAEKIRELVPSRKMYVLLGAKTKKEILCARDFSQTGAEILITTEDGSIGKKGFVTELFEQFVSKCPPQDVDVYACGPKPMFRKIFEISKRCNLICQFSLEERMACGTGVCMGCSVKTKSGYKLCCKDGPVFFSHELDWE